MDDVDLFAGTGRLGYENASADSRFVELQEELRSVVFTGLSGLSTEPVYVVDGSPDSSADDHAFSAGRSSPGDLLDLATLAIPKARLTAYLANWVTHCAPQLDKFDEDAHFQTEVPLLARREPALLYALLAFSARQMERTSQDPASAAPYDSLALYQESIRHLAPRLLAKDPHTLVTACVLAVFELMVGRSHDWRRHLEGCAALFAFFGVHGFSPGLGRAVFWCYARMDLCGAIMSEGSESTMLPLGGWLGVGGVPDARGTTSPHGDPDEHHARALFQTHGQTAPAVYACWAVYLCAQVCHLRVVRRQSGGTDSAFSFSARWTQLWRELARWHRARPSALLPVIDADDADGDADAVFPLVFFAHYAAISSNQLYHTACILMLEMRGEEEAIPDDNAPSPIWHARRVCGISCSNAHNGSWVNAIQPLYVAGRYFTHLTERLRIARLLKTIDRATGWGTLWRLRDLEAEWGFDEGELLAVL